MLGHPPVRCVSISCSLPAGRTADRRWAGW